MTHKWWPISRPEPARRRATKIQRFARWSAVIVAATSCVACSDSPEYAGDAFTSLVSPADAFPAPPLATAEAHAGFLVPFGYGGCPPWSLPTDEEVIQADGTWSGVRYDWSEAGEAVTWAITARTSGFDETNEEAVADSFREALTECGDDLEISTTELPGGEPELAISPAALDGLPDGAIAFEMKAKPDEYRTRPMHMFGALVVDPTNSDEDAAQPTHAVAVAWMGWGTEVPADGFVEAVNSVVQAVGYAAEETS